MIKIKKIIFFIIKSALTLVVLSTLVLFFYAAFFYEQSPVERKTAENKITKIEKLPGNEEEQRLKESQEQEKISKSEVEQTSIATQDKTKIKQTEIKDALLATIGNKAVTQSDLLNEIKIILILSNLRYSDDIKKQVRTMAINSIIKRTTKQIEINKNDFLEYNKQDYNKRLNQLANNINVNLDKLKKIFAFNKLDFSIIEEQVKVELLWNSLIFYLYKDRLTINTDEIEEQLKLIKNKKEIEEYLISEILVKPVKKDKLKTEIKELKNKIKIEGFEKVAINLSISETAIKGGDLGWLSENVISKKYRSKIVNTTVGNLSEPILLPEGILIFKIRDKRKIKKNISLEEAKNQLVNSEKTKILNMHSLKHYDNIKMSVPVKFFNE